MDLIERNHGEKRYSWSKVGVFVCFTLSAALLLNSLLHPKTLTSGSTKPSIQSSAAPADLYDR